MCSQNCIQLLRVSICIVPIGLALCIHVSTEGQPVGETIVCHRSHRMLWHVRNVFVLIIYGILTFSIYILIKLAASITITHSPIKSTIEKLSSQSSFYTTAMTLSGIHHHTSEAIIARHDRELLVGHLHIESTQVKMQHVVEEIQMSTSLIIPGSLRLVGDGLINTLIILLGMLYMIIPTHCLIAVGIQFGL